MHDVRERLTRASELVTPPGRPFDRMIARRDRKRRSQRLASAAVAFVIASGAVGGGVILLSRLAQDHLGPGEGEGWRSTKELAMEPGDYFYLRVESSDLGDGHVRDEETWWALDGSGEVRNRGTRQDKYPYPPTGMYGPGDFPLWLERVSSLSTDPAVLAAQLREEPWNWGEPPESRQLWGVIRTLLFESPNASPELRAALFDVMTGIDSVIVEEGERDPAGRSSVRARFSDESEGATWDLFFDSGTHQAIAWTFRSSRDGYVWETVESAIVAQAGVRPTEDQWLVPKLPAGTP